MTLPLTLPAPSSNGVQSMQHVGGLDLSLTSTGVAIITQRVNGVCLANVSTVTSRGKRGDTLVDRSTRLLTLRNEIIYVLGLCQLVVVEGPAFGTKGGSPLDRYGLWWSTVGKLLDLGVKVAVCPPSTNKKFITGSGNASKGAVCAAITRLWPDVQLSPKANAAEDEADALALAHAGAVWSGWQVPTLQRHIDALDKIAWPDKPVIDIEEAV